MKLIVVLCIGIGIGYAYGFGDAKSHEQNVVVRIVERVGGSNRDKYKTDVDKQMERLENSK